MPTFVSNQRNTAMNLETGQIYHIFNQGNNRQPIFFERDNYLYFLGKMRIYLLPHCQLLAYCLMPNHFHWLVEVTNEDAIIRTQEVIQSHPLSNEPIKHRRFNDSIGILLRSYSRAINKRYNRSGCLFREATKAEALISSKGISPSFFKTEFGTNINVHLPEEEYLQICFDYIHQNPVTARLVSQADDWEFSSRRDYSYLRDGTLVAKTRTLELGILL